MARIEEYAFRAIRRRARWSAATVAWMALLSAFDSGACFAALLGDRENGRWRFSPEEKSSRRAAVIGGTPILETEIETTDVVVRLIDFMPPRGENPDIVRNQLRVFAAVCE